MISNQGKPSMFIVYLLSDYIIDLLILSVLSETYLIFKRNFMGEGITRTIIGIGPITAYTYLSILFWEICNKDDK